VLTTATTIAGTSTLSELESFIDQNEEVLGPLVDLGNAGPNSVLTFDQSDPPPQQFVILRATLPGGITPVVPGYSLVCQGNCLVGGVLTGVAALRSDADKPSLPSLKPVSAQEQAVMGELPAALALKDVITQAAAGKNLPPAIVAAIGSVESAWGTSVLMQPNGPAGTGDRAPRPPNPPLRPGSMPTDGLGFGRGLMQIDWDAHDFARTGNWRDASANIAFSCSHPGPWAEGDDCARHLRGQGAVPRRFLPLERFRRRRGLQSCEGPRRRTLRGGESAGLSWHVGAERPVRGLRPEGR
jgi:hypothetical protein